MMHGPANVKFKRTCNVGQDVVLITACTKCFTLTTVLSSAFTTFHQAQLYTGHAPQEQVPTEALPVAQILIILSDNCWLSFRINVSHSSNRTHA